MAVVRVSLCHLLAVCLVATYYLSEPELAHLGSGYRRVPFSSYCWCEDDMRWKTLNTVGIWHSGHTEGEEEAFHQFTKSASAPWPGLEPVLGYRVCKAKQVDLLMRMWDCGTQEMPT